MRTKHNAPYIRVAITRAGEQKRAFSLPIESLNEAVERVERLVEANTSGFIKGSITKLQLREINGKTLGTSRAMRYYGLTVNETERLIKQAFGMEWVERVETL